MKILLVSRHCILGGAETFMLGLRAAIQESGHHCELFFFSHGQLERYLPADCVAHFGDLADCLRLVARRGFDIVHARGSDWEIGIGAVRRTGTKLIVTSHGQIERGWTAATCDGFAACSGWLAREQQASTDVRVVAILNGIDTARFHPDPAAPPDAPPIVAWIGRGAEPRKRLDVFAEIAPGLRRAGMRVWVVDPYGPDAVARVMPDAADRLRPAADFWGPVAIEDMPAMYRTVAASGGCVVSTAAWEGLPLTLLEAQACGAPAIGPDVPGTNECVDPGHGGLLYPYGCPADDLLDLVRRTVADAAGMRRRSVACAAYVRARFDVRRMAEEYLRFYREAPYPPYGSLVSRARKRLALSPLTNWRNYVEYRWSPGYRQFEASQRLAKEDHWTLARDALRASVATSPTIFAKPSRMAFLLRAHAVHDRPHSEWRPRARL